MPVQLPGIHHVTAIASSPQRNVDFYTRVLGLRLVKKTVNFDDPTTYHLYYGDEVGRPGTVMTFFPWPDARPGRVGTGQVSTTAFMIPTGSTDYWTDRLIDHGIETDAPITRFDDEVVEVRDPDGLPVSLVTAPGADDVKAWDDGPVPPEHAIRGFHGATLAVEAEERTAELLETMGFEAIAESRGQRFRHESTANVGAAIDLLCRPDLGPGQTSAGTVHHIAFRVPTADDQAEWRTHLVDAGYNVTPVIDRQYFHSIYFREPAGVLFEIATDPPGFTTDEPIETLGTGLKLPPWLEPRRDQLEATLPVVPAATAGDST